MARDFQVAVGTTRYADCFLVSFECSNLLLSRHSVSSGFEFIKLFNDIIPLIFVKLSANDLIHSQYIYLFKYFFIINITPFFTEQALSVKQYYCMLCVGIEANNLRFLNKKGHVLFYASYLLLVITTTKPHTLFLWCA